MYYVITISIYKSISCKDKECYSEALAQDNRTKRVLGATWK